MKLLVIGLGSMGKRRIRLLLNNFKGISVCGADVREERRTEVQALFQIPLYADFLSAIQEEHPDAAIVCSSPESHGDILLECIRQKLHVFSELNLLQRQYNAILLLAEQNNVKLFLSSTQLYRWEMEMIQGFVLQQKTKLNYRYHVGQYLPDWHPWEDYRDFFVANKQTNACREIFAIELPWLIRTFGKVEKVTVFKDQMTNLHLDYPDNYFVIMEHTNGNKGVFLVDIVSRKAERNLLVYSENLHLMWGGTPENLCVYNLEKKAVESLRPQGDWEKSVTTPDFTLEKAYWEELSVFLDKISGKANRERYTFEDDLETLNLIDRIEGIA